MSTQKGHHPLTEAPVNIIQQLIESFNVMATLATVKHLLESFADCGRLVLCPGNILSS